MTSREAAAFHEAGHIVVGLAHGLVVGQADIIPTAEYAGITHFENDRLFEHEVDDDLVDAWGAMTWAGVLAQERAGFPDDGHGFGHLDDGTGGAADGSDLTSLLELVARFVGEDGDEASARWRDLAKQTVADNWPVIEQIAARLATQGRLSSDDAVRLVRDG